MSTIDHYFKPVSTIWATYHTSLSLNFRPFGARIPTKIHLQTFTLPGRLHRKDKPLAYTQDRHFPPAFNEKRVTQPQIFCRSYLITSHEKRKNSHHQLKYRCNSIPIRCNSIPIRCNSIPSRCNSIPIWWLKFQPSWKICESRCQQRVSKNWWPRTSRIIFQEIWQKDTTDVEPVHLLRWWFGKGGSF